MFSNQIYLHIHICIYNIDTTYSMSTNFNSIDLVRKEVLVTRVLPLSLFFSIESGEIIWRMISIMMMMTLMVMMILIRHTAQSSTVQLLQLIRLSRYALRFLLVRPSYAHYHNSDISLFLFSSSFLHRLYIIPCACVYGFALEEKCDFNEFFFFLLRLLCPAHRIHIDSHFL